LESRRNAVILFRSCQVFEKQRDHRKRTYWKLIARFIPSRTAEQCEYKWSMARKHKTKKASWSKLEDESLCKILQENDSPNWKQVADTLNAHTKNSHKRKYKQCRERWLNFLNPNINRTTWSLLEDARLMRLVLQNGKKWSTICKFMDGRTENAVKNRYNSLMKKERKEFEVWTTADNKPQNEEFANLVESLNHFEHRFREEKLENLLFIRFLKKLEIELGLTGEEIDKQIDSNECEDLKRSSPEIEENKKIQKLTGNSTTQSVTSIKEDKMSSHSETRSNIDS